MRFMGKNDERWTEFGKVRAKESGGALTLHIDGLTSRPRYYKTLIGSFFRKSWRGSRPGFGDYSVNILVEHIGPPPRIDLDNIAKAVLDAIKGYVFHDDAQVARLSVTRSEGARERLIVEITKHL